MVEQRHILHGVSATLYKSEQLFMFENKEFNYLVENEAYLGVLGFGILALRVAGRLKDAIAY